VVHLLSGVVLVVYKRLDPGSIVAILWLVRNIRNKDGVINVDLLKYNL